MHFIFTSITSFLQAPEWQRWLRKPVYLPLFQTVEGVERAFQGFLNAIERYEKEAVSEAGGSEEEVRARQSIVVEEYATSFLLNVTEAEAVRELLEIVLWLLSNLLDPPRDSSPGSSEGLIGYRSKLEAIARLTVQV